MRIIHKRGADLAKDSGAIHIIDTQENPGTRVDILVGTNRYTIEESHGALCIYSLSGDIGIIPQARNAVELRSRGF